MTQNSSKILLFLTEEVKKRWGTKYLYLKNVMQFSPNICYISYSYEYKLSYQKSVKSEGIGDISYLPCSI